MIRRYALSFSNLGRHYSSAMSTTPIEDAIRGKLTDALNPTLLEVYNDSHLHAHHKAMAGNTSQETHFKLVIISSAFSEKRQPTRHRMVYAVLHDEMAQQGGIHALQLRTLTPEEEAARSQRERERAERETIEQQAAADAASLPSPTTTTTTPSSSSSSPEISSSADPAHQQTSAVSPTVSGKVAVADAA